MLKLKYALLASLCLLPLTATETFAATAGVTAAVNQNAKSTPPGGAVRTVVLGANVVQDETIETDGGGLVQILLADGTTFTVGPNSAITIDRFVYDPDANTAQVSATIGRGVFRFIGGRTSKTEGGVQLNTPVGTVGIRGGMADLNFTGAGQIDLLFGNEVTLNGPNGSDRIFQPGYSIVFGSNGQPTVIKTPPGSANFIQQALAGRPGSSGGSSQKPDDGKVAGSGVPGANSGSNPPPQQQIPQPDLRAIELATPKPNDNHQVAENVSQDLPRPGKRGFAAGTFYFDSSEVSGVGAPASDLDGDTRILFDANGNPIGGLIVIGMEGAEDFEGDIYKFKVATRVGEYPYSGRLSLSFQDQEYGVITQVDTSITDSRALDPEEWFGVGANSTKLVDCTCVDWGTWEAAFDYGAFGDAGLKGAWVTADIIDPSQYANFASDYAFGSVSYQGTAAGFGQYTVGGVAQNMFEATGEIYVTWDLLHDVGTFSLTSFGGTGPSPDNHRFNAEVDIARGQMEGGLFAGATDLGGGSSTSYFDVSGAFINDGTYVGAGVIGSFSGIEVFEVDEDTVLFTANGIFAGEQAGY